MLTWRKWQNSKHSSRSPWVQVLKDLMKNMEGRCQVPDLSSQKANLDEFDPGAETEPLGGDGDDASDASNLSSDGIPDGFMGEDKYLPEYDGSSPGTPDSDMKPAIDSDAPHLNIRNCLLNTCL